MNARWNALALSYSNEIVILLYTKTPKIVYLGLLYGFLHSLSRLNSEIF